MVGAGDNIGVDILECHCYASMISGGGRKMYLVNVLVGVLAEKNSELHRHCELEVDFDEGERCEYLQRQMMAEEPSQEAATKQSLLLMIRTG